MSADAVGAILHGLQNDELIIMLFVVPNPSGSSLEKRKSNTKPLQKCISVVWYAIEETPEESAPVSVPAVRGEKADVPVSWF